MDFIDSRPVDAALINEYSEPVVVFFLSREGRSRLVGQGFLTDSPKLMSVLNLANQKQRVFSTFLDLPYSYPYLVAIQRFLG
ncbi:hypothetical protein L596_011292 [Steinernema carpocapsae]|uniref:Uncharacterized protein n=1 Tax=Steinernema carpocapsae TaxID=34508 RepID=A0A4U5NUD9_STECR|nr:hypothetical protein L596_011292 [Steinernema carpocapsae]